MVNVTFVVTPGTQTNAIEMAGSVLEHAVVMVVDEIDEKGVYQGSFSAAWIARFVHIVKLGCKRLVVLHDRTSPLDQWLEGMGEEGRAVVKMLVTAVCDAQETSRASVEQAEVNAGMPNETNILVVTADEARRLMEVMGGAKA